MGLRHPANDGEPQTRAGVAGGAVEPFGHRRPTLRRNAGTVVGDLDHHLGRRARVGRGWVGCCRVGCKRDGDPSARPAVIEGVVDQIAHRFAQQGRVGRHQGVGKSAVEAELHPPAQSQGGEVSQCVGQQNAEIDRFRSDQFGAMGNEGMGQKLVHPAAGLVDRFGQSGIGFSLGGGEVGLSLGEVDVRLEACQGRAHLVSGVGDEVAHAVELLAEPPGEAVEGLDELHDFGRNGSGQRAQIGGVAVQKVGLQLAQGAQDCVDDETRQQDRKPHHHEDRHDRSQSHLAGERIAGQPGLPDLHGGPALELRVGQQPADAHEANRLAAIGAVGEVGVSRSFPQTDGRQIVVAGHHRAVRGHDLVEDPVVLGQRKHVESGHRQIDGDGTVDHGHRLGDRQRRPGQHLVVGGVGRPLAVAQRGGEEHGRSGQRQDQQAQGQGLPKGSAGRDHGVSGSASIRYPSPRRVRISIPASASARRRRSRPT